MVMSVKTFLPRTLAAAMISASILSAPIVVAGPKAVPFKATLTIQETFIEGDLLKCALISYVHGAGHASHLGKVTSESVDCINPTGPDLPPALRFVSTQVTLVAANGDKIFASYRGTITFDGVIMGASYDIDGGTGRFSSAEGYGTVSGIVAPISPTEAAGNIRLTGTISY